MEIKRLTPDKFEEFLAFHAKAYPSRLKVEERFKFQFLENPLLLDKSQPYIFLAYDQENNLMGQYGVNPSEYAFNGEVLPSFCGCDLFVSETHRKYGTGGFLSMKAINTCKPHISIGVSDEARPLLLALNMKNIGEVHLYCWLRKMIPALKSLFYSRNKKNMNADENRDSSQNKTAEFPSSLSANGYNFTLTTSLSDWKSPSFNLNSKVFEFTRPLSFLNWRFFQKPGYYLYSRQGQDPTYFVIKKTNWRGMSLLALVDYKCDLNDPASNKPVFQAMLKACKILAKKNDCSGIITLSSHSFFDKKLKKEWFFKVGSPFEIFTNAKLEFSPDQIKKREAAYITMVDSDLEFAFR